MTKLEKACEAITNYVQKYHGEDDLVKSWQEVIDLVRLSYPDIDPKGSNMHPSDICYNRANAMHKTKRFDKWPHALLCWIERHISWLGKTTLIPGTF